MSNRDLHTAVEKMRLELLKEADTLASGVVALPATVAVPVAT